jgi:hypothetical protein
VRRHKDSRCKRCSCQASSYGRKPLIVKKFNSPWGCADKGCWGSL